IFNYSAELITDEGGKAKFKVFAQNKIGKIPVKIEVLNIDDIVSETVFLNYGVTLLGNRQEGVTGSVLERPVGIVIYDSNSNPLSDVSVNFEIRDNKDAFIYPSNIFSDLEGKAFATLKLGQNTGNNTVKMTPYKKGMNFPVINIKAVGFDYDKLIILLLGSLAIFIFGMKMMSDGLQSIAGNKLKSILSFLTENRFFALATGAIATAVIQSSSACTVMIVGFLNAGLLTLKQSIPAIMGANIGTTITGQIIALKISDLAYPAVIIGIFIILIFRGKKGVHWGDFIFGFGLLFIGMKGMSDSLFPLRESESFKYFFSVLDCSPVNGIMPLWKVAGTICIGSIITAVIQSSSATIGLTMALAGSGLISFWTAFPLILGDNIGTTITAIFASIPGSRNAKRAGIFHSIFNISGTVLMILLLYVSVDKTPIFLKFINWITPGDVFSPEPVNIEKHIAMAHSFFNVSMAVLFLPFTNKLASLVKFILPEKDYEKTIIHLDENLLNTPELAFNQVQAEFEYMLSVAVKNLFRAYSEFMGIKTGKAEKIKRKEELIDNLQKEITEYLVKLSGKELNYELSERIPAFVHCVNDAERIGDLAEKIEKLSNVKLQNKLVFSQEALNDIEKMKKAIEHNYNILCSLISGKSQLLYELLKKDEDLNKLNSLLIEENISRTRSGECSDRSSIIFVEIMTVMERVGDHIVNIGERYKQITGKR
ncbi:MAG: Na/Pi cotransporter family protein, partial [Candidatus Muirbacterium halophilum]|nr:Na/Pi cotransporter family protein [Candidatus Muirbacterium halophilum]